MRRNNVGPGARNTPFPGPYDICTTPVVRKVRANYSKYLDVDVDVVVVVVVVGHRIPR